VRPLLSRLDPHRADASAREAARTLGMLPFLSSEGYSEIARNDLAVHITGSAHGLDDDTTLSAMVLRGIAAAKGIAIPTTAMERRALWREAGVITDSVSSTVLTLGLRPLGSGKREREMCDRADDSLETHLTARDLSRILWRLAPNTTVYVCENPRIVEAASDARSQAAVVCTFGNPNSVVLDLLSHLLGAGAAFRYHGDFDWPGIAIANRIMAHVGAISWQMGSTDYLAAVVSATGELPPLTGKPISASWDLALEQAMLEVGRVVHEELVLDRLLADLVS
ncbi:MAG: TIGR02679 family protein, partial [Ferrimicrobium sp.]